MLPHISSMILLYVKLVTEWIEVCESTVVFGLNTTQLVPMEQS